MALEFLESGTTALTWAGIVFCISQSAMFSGLNLAYFSISRLRLEVEAASGDAAAKKILKMREDSNLLLTTILWGNVGINVLLTLLSNSVMAGLTAFLFSTLLITVAGEIAPQAYFSRNALRIGAILAPVLRVYQILLYPIAKPIALILDLWLGKEGVQYLKERDIREILKKHMNARETDLERIESLGALNFLSIDDLTAIQEGEPLHADSLITVAFDGDIPNIPPSDSAEFKTFLDAVQKSGKKWVVLLDAAGTPKLVLNSDGFIRKALLASEPLVPKEFYHKPILIEDTATRLGTVLPKLEVTPKYQGDNVIDRDVILVWSEEKRVITGADILGRLLVGITRQADKVA